MARKKQYLKEAIEAKQFGRLTGGEVKAAVEIREKYGLLLGKALPDLFKGKLVSAIEREHGPITWAWVYDLPDMAALALAVVVLGMADQLADAARQTNPTAAALACAVREVDSEEPVEVPEGVEYDVLRVALITAWHFNDAAVSYYSQSVNRLIARGRAGDDQGFINAVSIDPSAAGSEAFTHRLGKARIFNHSKFLKRYRAALKGPHDRRRTHRNLRWTDCILRDIGAQDTAKFAEIVALVTGHLKQYSTQGEPEKGLQALFSDWRKEATS